MRHYPTIKELAAQLDAQHVANLARRYMDTATHMALVVRVGRSLANTIREAIKAGHVNDQALPALRHAIQQWEVNDR